MLVDKMQCHSRWVSDVLSVSRNAANRWNATVSCSKKLIAQMIMMKQLRQRIQLECLYDNPAQPKRRVVEFNLHKEEANCDLYEEKIYGY